MTTTRLSRAIAAVVYRELSERELPEAEFARNAGIEKTRVHRLMRGKVKSVSVDEAEAYAKAFHWSFGKLLREATALAETFTEDELLLSMQPHTQRAIAPLRTDTPRDPDS